MPKTQLRMPKSTQQATETPVAVAAPTRKKTQLRLPGAGAPAPAATKAAAPPAPSNGKASKTAPINQIPLTNVRMRKKAAEPVAVQTLAPEETFPKKSPMPKRGKSQTSATPEPAPEPVVEKKPRTPRIRTKVAVHKFLPRVERLATLKTPRAIEYLKNIESRAQEVRRADFSQKFPMSILEMKALNEAIRIMQVKLKLEGEYAEEVKASTNGESQPKPKKART
jgi:hypothetical protein